MYEQIHQTLGVDFAGRLSQLHGGMERRSGSLLFRRGFYLGPADAGRTGAWGEGLIFLVAGMQDLLRQALVGEHLVRLHGLVAAGVVLRVSTRQ